MSPEFLLFQEEFTVGREFGAASFGGGSGRIRAFRARAFGAAPNTGTQAPTKFMLRSAFHVSFPSYKNKFNKSKVIIYKCNVSKQVESLALRKGNFIL
jgi:hypothetical protein